MSEKTSHEGIIAVKGLTANVEFAYLLATFGTIIDHGGE